MNVGKTRLNFGITNLTKGKLPSLPFGSMKDAVLGQRYDLSLIFCSKRMIADLNKRYRGIGKPTDILSFALGPREGEIFISLEAARSQSKQFGRTFENFIGFLFIHGLLHLKGFRHGSRMETLEAKCRKRFGV